MRKSLAKRLLIAPTRPPEAFGVVTKDPVVLALLVTPLLEVRASKLKVQIDLMSTGPPWPASWQLCANGCAAASSLLVIDSKRGTSAAPSSFTSSMNVARLQLF